MIKRERINSYLQSITQKTKHRATRTLLKTVTELRCSEWQAVPAPHVTPVVLLLVQTR